MGGTMTPQRAPGEKPGPPFPSFSARLCRYRDDDAAFTTTRWTVFKVPCDLSSEQSAAGNTGSAMERLRQMVRLMRLTPHGAPPACPTEVHRVGDAAAAYLPPVAVADGPNASATVTVHDRSVCRVFLVTHVPPSSLSCTSSCRF